MPRAATTSDIFNAIAESRRRDILVYLAPAERPVGDIVIALGLGQPSVSKHLKVLRNVGLVHVRRERRQMFYRTNAEGIRGGQEQIILRVSLRPRAPCVRSSPRSRLTWRTSNNFTRQSGILPP